MLVEVQTGSKPGRPTLLLILSAGVLALSLSTAWIQAHEKLSLAEPRPLAAGSPLIIRPPRGWVENQPGVFVLLQRNAGDEREGFERRVMFTHRRAPGYIDPRDVILNWDQRESAASIDATPARLAGIDAVEVIRRRRLRAFGGIVEQETILRVACFPTGDIVGVEYWPMEALTVADEQLMNSICDAVQLSTVNVQAADDAVMAALGVEFPIPPGCAVVGTASDGLPTLYLRSTSPALPFIVEVRRTWLAAGRDGSDLLADYSRTHMPWLRSRPRVVAHSRPDRVNVHTLYLPASVGVGRTAPAILLSTSSSDCVLLTYQAKTDTDALAGRIAQQLAETLVLKRSPLLPDLAAAADAGVELAELIQARGALPWWARRRQDALFVGRAGEVEAAARVRVVPSGGDSAGYSGSTTAVDTSSRDAHRSEWRLDGRAIGYTLELQKRQVGYLEPEVVVSEARDPSDSNVRRRRGVGAGPPVESSFPVEADFVAPPVETVAAAWAARREEGAWLITVSNPEGAGVSSRLLIALPQSGLGDRRVVVIDDYDPTPWIARFDGNDAPLNFRFRGLELDRRDEPDPRDEKVLKLLGRAERLPTRR